MKAKTAAVIASLFLVLTMAACGGGSSGITSAPSQPTGPSISSGIVVDPYIVGATFFADHNDNGRWDPGEPISGPSDEQGYFTFFTPVPAGRNIVMLEGGYHQGQPFTGRLMRWVGEGDSDPVVVSPLTTAVALGLDPTDLATLLSPLNDGTSSYDLDVDPMAGLADDENIPDLRANLFVGAVLDLLLLNLELAEISLANIDAYAYDQTLTELMTGLGEAVAANSIDLIEAELPAGFSDLPPVTMREVAETIPALLDWWKQELIRQSIDGDTVEITATEFQDLIAEAMPELGLHYYLRSNQDNSAVQEAIDDNLLPAASDRHAGLAQDRSKQLLGEPSLQQEFLSNRTFYVGNQSLLRFSYAASGNLGDISLNYQADGNTETINGTWRVEDNLLILGDNETTDILELELTTDWSSHLSLRIKGEAATSSSDSFVSKLLEEARRFQVVGS